MRACREWNDRLGDFVLGAAAMSGLEEHLEQCPACAGALVELRARREQIDAGLRQLVQGAEPSPAFGARVLTALEAHAATMAWRPARLGALAAVAVVLLGGVLLGRLGEPVRVMQLQLSGVTLSTWRSPTEGLLRSAAEELLGAPRLGEFYFSLESVALLTGEETGGNDES